MNFQTRFLTAFFLLGSLLFSGVAKADGISDLRQWMVGRMKSSSPPGRSFITGAKETPEEGLRRYDQIADDVISVAYDPSEKPVFPGRKGRARTAALILSIALFESAYRKDVDQNIGSEARGDGGRSWCMMQVQLGAPVQGKTPYRVVLTKEGYEFTKDQSLGVGGEDLISDRKNCLRVGIRMASRSFYSCRRLPILDRLSVYTAGNCDDEDGREKSRIRVGKAISWVNDFPPPLDDRAVLTLLYPPPASDTVMAAPFAAPRSSGEPPKILLVSQ